jgi:hypothetical protein
MKHMFHHHRVNELLETWASKRDLTKAAFYIWNSGSTMQMSQLGLLQSLVRTCVSECDASVNSVFPDRWKQFLAFGGGQEPFDCPELERALNCITSNQARRFFS